MDSSGLKTAAFKTADPSDLAGWLADRDVPCPLCGYNLRGLAGNRCPECGRELRLGVSAVEPFLKAWVAVLVALLLPAAFGLLVIFTATYGLVRFGGTSIGRGGWTLPVGPTLVLVHVVGSVPASIVTLACRRRFLRWPRPRQVAAAAAAWVALAASMLYLVGMVLS